MKARKIVASLAILSVMSLTLASCAPQGSGQGGFQGIGGYGPKQTVGGLAGAATGAIVGSNIGGGKGNIAAIALGTLLGAAIGGEIGASLDRADMAYYGQASQNAFENARTGQQVAWRNPDSGNNGIIVPTNTYQNQNGDYCREFNQKITVGGKTQSAYGVACRQPDGTWRVVQ